MVKDFKPLIELQHIHMDTSNEKACEAKLLKYKKCLNFDNYTNENKTEQILIGYIFRMIHTDINN